MLPPKSPLSGAYYRILRRLWKKGASNERELAQELGLSRTVVQRQLTRMSEEGVVGPGDSQLSSELRADYGSVLGIHLGTRIISTVLIDFTGRVLLKRDFPHLVRGELFTNEVLDLTAQMEQLIQMNHLPQLRGVALSLPGIVDPYKLILLESNPLDVYEPLALKEGLGRALARPLTAENDANCCCWGEAVLQRPHDLGNALFLLAEERPRKVSPDLSGAYHLSVGMGLYLRGSVYHGSRFSAGEFKSIYREKDRLLGQFSLSDEEMARAGAGEAEEALARELARHAALLVNVLNLDRVFVSWPRFDKAPRILEILREEIAANWNYSGPVKCTVDLPSLGFLTPAYGAAALHLESLYQTADGPAPYFPGKS